MVLIFFEAKGVIYMNDVPMGKTAKAEYIKKALARFLKVSREKRPIMSSHDCVSAPEQHRSPYHHLSSG
jgi:hypothetical protein